MSLLNCSNCGQHTADSHGAVCGECSEMHDKAFSDRITTLELDLGEAKRREMELQDELRIATEVRDSWKRQSQENRVNETKLAADIKTLQAEIKLTKDLSNALHANKSPCGHPEYFAYTEDAGRTVDCLLCIKLEAKSLAARVVDTLQAELSLAKQECDEEMHSRLADLEELENILGLSNSGSIGSQVMPAARELAARVKTLEDALTSARTAMIEWNRWETPDIAHQHVLDILEQALAAKEPK